MATGFIRKRSAPPKGTGEAAGVSFVNDVLTFNSDGTNTRTVLTTDAAVVSTSPTAGIGYSTGAGGAVTQLTSASTTVTLNKVTGQITTVALTTAPAAEETFVVVNSAVAATDIIAVTPIYAGAGTVQVGTLNPAAGSFKIVIANLHASATFDATMTINYAVINGVAS